MKIILSFKEDLRKEIVWKAAFFPSIGHKLLIVDFLTEDEIQKFKLKTVFCIIDDILWLNSEGSPKADLRLRNILRVDE
ncbi:hypothetical protein ASG01_15200 [Chryseobacterium sp. Leaf180]|uniref:hypothetical protein n=1 Tax=Chryseobacterium sp. Leaf180 TaxID=1736289 RepID=UPI0006F47445|nr:hypothetical protein [Chryseobacterium sp. Leaf180]KQR94221.1 hypothetical protein ASG01_15200 [Chryseobacterium sp. Leaf180]